MAQQKINKSDPVGVRFSPKVREDLERMSSIMGISVADIVRLSVKEYIDRNIEQQPPVDRIASAVVEQLLAKGLVGNIGAQKTVKEDKNGQ
jgi:hypothetical protein